MSTKITEVWSEIHPEIIADGSGMIKKVINVDAVTASIDNILRTWPGERCFIGSTKIRLLNGTDVAIQDLVQVPKFWVYSFNPSLGVIEPAQAYARCTGYSKEIITVVLDNGEEIRCTPEHLFMLRNGHFLAAQDLVVGTSLMPLYIRTDSDGYLSVYQPFKDIWEAYRKSLGKSAGGYPTWKVLSAQFPTIVNHKVVSISRSLECVPVYDLYVENNHNFALSSGVFVHNCMLPQFGSPLRSVLFERMTNPELNHIVDQLQVAIEAWDDRVQITEMSVTQQPDKGQLYLEVLFRIKGNDMVFQYSTPVSGEVVQ